MLKPCTHRPAGFTLIEVMMATTIIVVGFIGMIQAVTIGSEMLDTSRKQMVAQQIMDFEIEQLRSGSWNTILTMSAGTTYSITVNNTGTAASGSTTYFATDTKTALMGLAKDFVLYATATDLRTDFRKIVYTVTWTSNTGRGYSRTTEAYFGKNGLHLSYQKS